ncbi:MAG: hypothetical protein KGL59_15700, partial [Acidobacteriota bacterium]|nr:hypothetical protein [Acidobacteriota bacterium]
MAALFGPLAGIGFNDPGTYLSAPAYNGAANSAIGGEPAWWRYLGLGNGPIQVVKSPTPIYPAPPVRNFDVTGMSFAPPEAATVVGAQRTRADRLFGPFARIGSSALSGG